MFLKRILKRILKLFSVLNILKLICILISLYVIFKIFIYYELFLECKNLISNNLLYKNKIDKYYELKLSDSKRKKSDNVTSFVLFLVELIYYYLFKKK